MLVLANKILSYFFMQSLSIIVVTCTHRSNCTKIAGIRKRFMLLRMVQLFLKRFPEST